MKQNLFANSADININYLEKTYGQDLKTAGVVFSAYLQGLPSHLADFSGAVQRHDIYEFRALIHKLIPSFTYVGLIDVSEKLQEISLKCITAKDMVLYDIEIQDLIKRIISSTRAVEEIQSRLAAA
jgi:hypothetical protein